MNRAYKAKQLRYRRAALSLVRRDNLEEVLYEIGSECTDLEWAVEDDETLLDVFDGGADEIHEFRFAFSDLSHKCERLSYELSEAYVTEHFDDFFVGALGDTYTMVGYDGFEEDYFNLTKFEAGLAQGESGKRLMSLTKEQLISVAGQCIGVMMSFIDVRHSYDCLKAVFELLRDERAELMKNVRTIEDAYQKVQDDPHNYDVLNEYDNLLLRLPYRVWVE